MFGVFGMFSFVIVVCFFMCVLGLLVLGLRWCSFVYDVSCPSVAVDINSLASSNFQLVVSGTLSFGSSGCLALDFFSIC